MAIFSMLRNGRGMAARCRRRDNLAVKRDSSGVRCGGRRPGGPKDAWKDYFLQSKDENRRAAFDHLGWTFKWRIFLRTLIFR